MILSVSKKIQRNIFSAVAVLVLLCACERAEKTDENASQHLSAELLGPVLASVNGIEITELDLELAIERTLGNSGLIQVDDQARKKVLESLVMSKSLALQKQEELGAQELASVEREVMAYRDELLAKKYLRENISATPVTEEMVDAYYQKNPTMFGAKIQKSYELIQAKDSMASAERSAIVAALNTAKHEQDWQALVKKLTAKKLSVDYSQGAITQGTMAAEFERVLKPLQQDETSSVFFMRKLPAIVRVTQVITAAPKPLADVSHDIRKQLAPVQLKKAIRSSADEVMKTMNIEYQQSNY